MAIMALNGAQLSNYRLKQEAVLFFLLCEKSNGFMLFNQDLMFS